MPTAQPNSGVTRPTNGLGWCRWSADSKWHRHPRCARWCLSTHGPDRLRRGGGHEVEVFAGAAVCASNCAPVLGVQNGAAAAHHPARLRCGKGYANQVVVGATALGLPTAAAVLGVQDGAAIAHGPAGLRRGKDCDAQVDAGAAGLDRPRAAAILGVQDSAAIAHHPARFWRGKGYGCSSALVPRSLGAPLAHVEGSTHVGPRKAFTPQRSHPDSVNLGPGPPELLTLSARIAQPGL